MADLTDDHKVTHLLPWGEVTGYEIPDEHDRFYVRAGDVPAEHLPRFADDVDKAKLLLLWSLANKRPMSMLTELPDLTMAWDTCSQCAFGWRACKCRDGIHEARGVTWARRRDDDNWGSSSDATARRVTQSTGTQPVRAAARVTTGRTRPAVATQSTRGTSGGSTEDVGSLSLDEIEAGAAGAADRALASITGEASSAQATRTGRPVKRKRARR